jgi:hypothetical protein
MKSAGVVMIDIRLSVKAVLRIIDSAYCDFLDSTESGVPRISGGPVSQFISAPNAFGLSAIGCSATPNGNSSTLRVRIVGWKSALL